ncbi:MAG TPA: ribonuclease J [Candidatus Woesebacteria bacterium]|nr:ribonuclease J [Candidatus Woesebacteria bacterium]HPJ16777.1 ribonuclease J [Candidatus Woesebacteria bacterium]
MNNQFTNTKPQVQHFGTHRDSVRVASLGGFGDVTQNMFVYEYAPNGDFSKSQIIIADCGVGFPEEDAFGVDLQIPDTHYLQDKKDRILGIFITHGHEDHIGAVRFVLPLIGQSIPIYAPKLASAFIEQKLSETTIRAKINVYDVGDILKVGPFVIEPIRVTHSIPDTFHLAINTPIGVFYHGSDFKFDMFPLDGKASELRKIASYGSKNVVALMSDSLGSDHEGFSPSESSIAENFKQEIVSAKGRLFITAISSNIVRWSQAIEYGKSTGRKICVVGYSVDKAINVAKQLGYLTLKDTDIIAPERVKNFADNKLMFLVAGFAGQPDSALSKMVMGKHRIKIKEGDKVIFSSPDYIPGTTSNIYNMIDILSKMGAEVAYGEKDLHVSGHGYQKEHALLINLVNPKYLLPIGGNFRHIKTYFSMAKKMGYQKEQFILPDFDSAVTFYGDGHYDTNYHLSLHKVLIDGLGVGDVGTTVLRDRKLLAEDGMFTVVMLVNGESGELQKDPVILSRGFVFIKENSDLLNYLKEEVIKKFLETTSKPANFEYIRTQIQAHLETIILEKTGRQPMVLPLIIEV